MNDMGDIRVDESALVRSLGPEILAVAPGDMYRGMLEVTDAAGAEVIAFEDENFEIDPRLSAEERDRPRPDAGSHRADPDRARVRRVHRPLRRDRRGRPVRRLPLAAASSLMAKGYGYAAEGDVLTACMVYAGHQLIGDAHFTEMYAMDFPTDSILQSHMGEGNWKIARTDRPVRLIKRPLGIGAAGRPAHVPVPVPARPGHAGHAGVAGGHAVPAGLRRGREPGQPGTARAGDALRPVPAGHRACGPA